MRRLVALFASLLFTAAGVQAHDSWLVADPNGAGDLRLATGNRYPVADVQTPATPQCDAARLSCWIRTVPQDIEIEPAKVQVYFAEIQAGDSVRRTWAAWLADGLPWRERYEKFARIEMAGASQASPEARQLARQPVGAPLELVVLGDAPVTTGSPLRFQLLRDGVPLADFPIELVSERSAFGIWRRTDAQGRLQHTLPFGGKWLLRGTDLRVSPTAQGQWESRFVTLAIEAR